MKKAEVADCKTTLNQTVFVVLFESFEGSTTSTGNEVVDLVGVRGILDVLKVVIVSRE